MEKIRKRLEALRKELSIKKKEERLTELQEKAQDPSLWKDRKKGEEVMKEISSLQGEIEEIEEIKKFLELGEKKEAQKKLSQLELKIFLSGKYDQRDAFLSIHAGQGGIEAMDWTGMLARMYRRFAKDRGWKVKVVSETPGEEAGFQSLTLKIEGDYAYGYLKGEGGVHRLVRRSPFNADHLRQTSFALIEVLPAIKGETEVEIDPEEVEFEAFRASGPGGQRVNKVSTAVRLTHKPTGIAVECQEERSQSQNRARAMEMLRTRLAQKKRKKLAQEKKRLKGEYQVPGWGHRIRSYVLDPYKLVKDQRTEVEIEDAEGVLDGNLSPFIQAELRQGV